MQLTPISAKSSACVGAALQIAKHLRTFHNKYRRWKHKQEEKQRRQQQQQQSQDQATAAAAPGGGPSGVEVVPASFGPEAAANQAAAAATAAGGDGADMDEPLQWQSQDGWRQQQQRHGQQQGFGCDLEQPLQQQEPRQQHAGGNTEGCTAAGRVVIDLVSDDEVGQCLCFLPCHACAHQPTSRLS